MVYLTHYEQYPIYEPAEGGYYYAGNAVESYEVLSKRQAKKRIKQLAEDLLDEGFEFICNSYVGNYLVRRSKYIGEGESYKIEKRLGASEKGYEPYC